MKTPELAAVARVARRTARRNWKRTALVVALIAVPVAASQIAAGMIAAGQIAPEEYATQQLGAADVLVQSFAPTAASMSWVDDQLAELAPGAETSRYRNAYAAIPDVTEYLEVTDLDITAPLAAGKLGLVAGSSPDAPGEVALSDGLLQLTGAAVGGEVTLAIEGMGEVRTYTIVGQIRDVLYRNRAIALISPHDMDAVYADSAATGEYISRDASWLVATDQPDALASQLSARWEADRQDFRPVPSTPRPEILSFLDDDLYASLSADQVATLAALAQEQSPGEPVTSGPVVASSGSDQELIRFQDSVYQEAFRLLGGFSPLFPEVGVATFSSFAYWESGTDRVLHAPAVIGAVVAALLMAEVALVAGAAYATGIRRRLRELGLLSVNGATVRHLRSIVVGEGFIAGVLGAGIGSGIALAAMTLGRPVAQRLVDRFIEGTPLGLLELAAPAVVGIAAAIIAAWVPARSAARVPATTALEGRMPLSAPHRWVVPAGVGLTGFGTFLLIVAKTALGSSGAYQAGLGVALMIAGFALMASPMVAWMGRRADHFPAVSRLVVRDSARQRTRAATAIAATMVVLVAPVAAGAAIQTDIARTEIHGLDENPRHVLVAHESGYSIPPLGDVAPEDVAVVAGLLPDAEKLEFGVYDGLARLVDNGRSVADAHGNGDVGAMTIALGNGRLLEGLGVGDVADEFAAGQVIVLGLERRTVDVVVGDRVIPAIEVPANVMKFQFPRVLVTEEVAADLRLGESRNVVLFVNDDPLTEAEIVKVGDATAAARPVWAQRITPNQMMLIVGGATLLVVLLIVALVTALAATESDHDLRTMVAVGAPPRIRRRFLGIQTIYYTLFAAVLATPLAMLLLNVSTTDNWVEVGPFGSIDGSSVATPWLMIGIVVVGIPLVVGGLTALTVRSAPTVPPRRIG